MIQNYGSEGQAYIALVILDLAFSSCTDITPLFPLRGQTVKGARKIVLSSQCVFIHCIFYAPQSVPSRGSICIWLQSAAQEMAFGGNIAATAHQRMAFI
jgi:hypothetical protein